MTHPSYKVTLKRPVEIMERTDIIIEAEDEKTAAELALEIAENSGDIQWTETRADESEIGTAEVEKVMIHAYDDDVVVETDE